jgi:hypothetical protein
VTTQARDRNDVAAEPKGLPVRLDMDVIRSARIISAIRNQPMSDMLSEILRPILETMEQEAMSERMKELPQRPRRSKPN